MKKILIYILMILSLLFCVNSATIINQSLSDYADGMGTAVNWKAQTFNWTSNFNLSQVGFNFTKTGTPAGSTYVTIRATSSDLPTGGNLCLSSAITTNSINGVTPFTFTGCSLNGSTKYALVFYSSGADASNYLSYRFKNSNVYPNGTASYSTNSGSSWASAGTFDIEFFVVEATPVATPILTFSNISLINNTYFNTAIININTSVLNTSTNGNVNQSYYLYNYAGVQIGGLTQYATNNLNGSLNISLSEGLYKISFYAKNNQTNVSSMNYTFTKDTTAPVINNNILPEYNYYTNNNLNSSCTDTNLVSCNISMNSQNKLLNQSFNFTTNGNQTYNITAIDLAGNTVTESGVTLVNPYQTFRFYDYLRLTNINDFYIDGVLYSSNYTFKTYDYGLGSWDFDFSKEGYVNQTFNFSLNSTSNYNQTNNVTAVTITIKAYDINTLAQIPFNLTLSDGVIAQYYNQVNFTDYYNNTPQGDVNALIASTGYSDASYNINIGAYSALTLNAYLIPVNDSNLFQFTVLSQDTGAALANVLIEVQELINTSYITVSSKLTGDNGKTYFYLDSSKDYKVIFSKNEYVTATAFTIPTVTTYTVKLTGDSTTFNYVNEISYSFKPSEYLLQNNETYNFIGFISGNSLTSSNFSIVLNNGTTIYTNSNVNPTGTTYNYSYTIPPVANFTQMTMTINYIIDGELFTVSKEYKVITLNEDSFIKTMQNFGESNTEESNLWKWFIVMIATVLVLISGVFLGTAVPLLIIPLWVFFSFAGWVDFTFTAVISVVALIMFLGGRR